MKRIGSIGVAVLLLLAGCGKPAGDAAPAVQSAAGKSVGDIDGIAWFEGGIDAAFAAAAEQHKPVFLYWGAEWCPPCHDLKAHVFSRQDFQDKLRQFIPVYLDGDAQGAQRIAGEFQVLGYPTAVVLTEDRGEIARIAGGNDLASYADVLDLALDNVRPLPELLAALRARPLKPSAADCRRLAYNGWTLDPRTDPASLVESLWIAAQRCPAEAQAERDRLIAVAADLAAGSERGAIESGKAASPRLAGLLDSVGALLADRERARTNGDALLYLGEDFFAVARRVRPAGVARLQQDYFALADAVEADARYSDTTRLDSAGARLRAARALDAQGAIPEAVAAKARATLDEFLGRGYEGYSRAGIINAASWVLSYLGEDARLKELLLAEISTSRTPYYYYPDIGDLEEKAGNTAQALEWFERGYRESSGPATRFQWGTIWLQALLRLAPGDEPRIRAAVIEVLGELDGPDRIHARTRGRLERLDTALGEWAGGKGNGDALVAIGQHWRQICAKLPESDPVHGECPRLLAAGAG